MTATFDDIVKQLEVLNKTCSQMAKLLEFSIQKEWKMPCLKFSRVQEIEKSTNYLMVLDLLET